MANDFDLELARLFANARESLPGEAFAVPLLSRLERQRRTRLMSRAVVGIAAIVLLAVKLPHIWTKAVAVGVSLTELLPLSSHPLSTPVGWAVSMLVGLGVLYRTTHPRRTWR